MFNPDTWILNALQTSIENAANRARELAKTDRIAQAIQKVDAQKQGDVYTASLLVRLSDAPEARAFEYGSGLQSTKGPQQKYPIRAKNVPNLVFWWQREGKWFVGPAVQHPGVKAEPALRPALEEELPRLKRDIAQRIKTDFNAFIRDLNQEMNHAK